MIYKIPNTKKLWCGKVSVRDYVVKDCLKKQEHLTIYYQGEKMILTPKQLTSYTQWNPRTFKSKHNNQTYALLDFTWTPRQEIKEVLQVKQGTLL